MVERQGKIGEWNSKLSDQDGTVNSGARYQEMIINININKFQINVDRCSINNENSRPRDEPPSVKTRTSGNSNKLEEGKNKDEGRRPESG